MVIHIVRPGDTVYGLALEYGVPMSQLVEDNGISGSYQLTQGQALVVQFPRQVHTVRAGETLSSVARQYGVTTRQLFRNNPILAGSPTLYPGQTLVISYQGEKEGTLSVNGYAYPHIDQELLRSSVPYLTYLTPFTYGFTPQGTLVDLDDGALLAAARAGGAAPLMHLSTLTEDGGFSNDLAHAALNDLRMQEILIENVVRMMEEKGYQGLDIDFEYVFPEDAVPYAQFIRRLNQRLNPLGWPVIAALAPKISADQQGLLYQGHDYDAIGAAADRVLLMTYEWGYTYGPPMAVAPVNKVRQVVEYAVTRIDPSKIDLGIPNYGYDWTLPFVQGSSRATTVSNQEAVRIAIEADVPIQFDEVAMSPFFQYEKDGQMHEVWFEDVRSYREKFSLLPAYGLRGMGYWQIMRFFRPNWLLLNDTFQIQKP